MAEQSLNTQKAQGGIFFYSKDGCPWCQLLETELKQSGFTCYRVIKLDSKYHAKLKELTGMTTFPMLFFGEQCIGGYSEFCKWKNGLNFNQS